MVIELQIVTDVLSNPDANGDRKIIARNALINKLFDINEIEVEEFLNPRTGKPVKKYTGIYSNNLYYKVNKPYDELKQLKINKTYPVKGFMAYSKKYKNS